MVQITAEPTPNPAALKFTLDRPSTAGRPETFKEGSTEEDSALGARIFALGGVTNVFLTADFVSVTKADGEDWDTLAERVVATIQEHFGTS